MCGTSHGASGSLASGSTAGAFVLVLLAASTGIASSLKAARTVAELPDFVGFHGGMAPAPAFMPVPAPAPPQYRAWGAVFNGAPGPGPMPYSSGMNSTDEAINFAEAGPHAPPFSMEQCGVETMGPLCFGDEMVGRQVVLPGAVGDGLVGYWSFDKGSSMDASGMMNHGFGPVGTGPAFGGQGSSGFFRRNFLEIPDNGNLHLKDFSYTFWLYLIDEAPSGLRSCPLLRKGLGSEERFLGDVTRKYDAAPAILYDHTSRRLRVELVTVGAPGEEANSPLVEAFESNAKLRASRWLHIGVTRDDVHKRTRLYVNGVLDSSHASKGVLKPMEESLYVGGDPLTREGCNLPMYVDELRVYNRALDTDEVQAEAAPALAGVEPNFVRLACVDCPLLLAEKLCPSDYHICSSLEMHMGGYQIAHMLGYLQPGGHVWTRSALDAAKKAAEKAAKAALERKNKKKKDGTGSGAPIAVGGSGQGAPIAVGGSGQGPGSGAEDGGSGTPIAKGSDGSPNALGGAGEPDPAANGGLPWDTVRGIVVSLVEEGAGKTAAAEATKEALAVLPKMGLGLCCVND